MIISGGLGPASYTPDRTDRHHGGPAGVVVTNRAMYWVLGPVLLGVVLGGGTLLLDDTDRKVEMAVSVLGLVLGLQLELIRRVLRRAGLHDRASRMIAQVEELPAEFAQRVRENAALLTVAARVGAGDTVYRRALETHLEDQRTWLDQFNAGIIEVESDDATLLLEWTAAARQSIRATMVARTDVHWWHSRPGRQLWQANLRALARGVMIQRVFMYDSSPAQLRTLVEEQAAAGVEAYVVRLDRLRPDLRIDITIIDNARSHEVVFS